MDRVCSVVLNGSVSSLAYREESILNASAGFDGEAGRGAVAFPDGVLFEDDRAAGVGFGFEAAPDFDATLGVDGLGDEFAFGEDRDFAAGLEVGPAFGVFDGDVFDAQAFGALGARDARGSAGDHVFVPTVVATNGVLGDRLFLSHIDRSAPKRGRMIRSA